MQVPAVIQQLRTYCPFFQLVGGAGDFATGIQMAVNPSGLPACYVFPLAEVAGENETLTGLVQTVTEKIAVVVQLDQSLDRRGQSGAMAQDGAKYAIFHALLAWTPYPPYTRTARGFSYAGGRTLDFDRERFFYQFEFDLVTTITDSDGWNPASVPLTEIAVTLTDSDLTEPVVGSIPLAQS